VSDLCFDSFHTTAQVLETYKTQHAAYKAQQKRLAKEQGKAAAQQKRLGAHKAATLKGAPAAAAAAAAAVASSAGNAAAAFGCASSGAGPLTLLDRPCAAFHAHALDPAPLAFTLGDLRRFSWSHADVVFCAATCFDGPLLAHIAETAARLRSGAILISLSEALRGDHLRLLHSVVYRMSWGRATVHVHERV
jgi:hypothetical protein